MNEFLIADMHCDTLSASLAGSPSGREADLRTQDTQVNFEKMKQDLKYFEGEHDFKAFKASGTSSKNSIRTIYETNIYENEDRIIIELTGNGFLYNMVRIIVGTLVEVGMGKIEPSQIENILKEGKRENAGKTLPPNGLYLLEVKY